MSTGPPAPSQDERFLFEHFVIAGLDDSKKLEKMTPATQECGLRNTQQLAPITDITVIFPQLGETVPKDYEIIDTTTLGYPADLNHGSLRVNSAFICYKRGYHKPPLTEIHIIDESKGENPQPETHVVRTTPFGNSANVNNASKALYLTYKRAIPNSSPNQLVLTDIKVILDDKGEIAPHTYYKIPRNLNNGFIGSNVYICYKKSKGSTRALAYKPAVLDYFPRTDYSPAMEDFKLAQNVAMFCLPMGAVIECWPAKSNLTERTFSTFVLTDENGTKFYGSAVTFYEKFDKELTDEQLEGLDLLADKTLNSEGGTVEDSNSNNDPADDVVFYKNLSICLISRYPFFNSFKRFLYFLHRISCFSMNDRTSVAIPIERYISHLMYEVSFPTPRRPCVFMNLAAENISFECHDDSQLPLHGHQLIDALKCLGTENLIYIMMLALLEQKLLIHSLRPYMLTAVAESICALMFPFQWQCPYIPQCPLSLAGVLHAPLPFIAGVDSKYFELYEDPPSDVTCFDLDTATINSSTVKATFKVSMLPKKYLKQLTEKLTKIYSELQKMQSEGQQRKGDRGYIPVEEDLVLKNKRRIIELDIHNAFLHFMVSIMKGYQTYLRPIKKAPIELNAIDTGKLFDVEGFLRSREKSGGEFYRRFCETQTFIRFIEERSFVSDRNTYNAFFDDCIIKAENAANNGISNVQLLEIESSLTQTTVFIPSPEPFTDPATGEVRKFTYTGFPVNLNRELFQLEMIEKSRKAGETVPVGFESSKSAAIRTKPEIKSSILAAVNAARTNPLNWAKTILFYSYSLWFMQLESLLLAAPNKKKILKLAFSILDRMESTEIFPLDQVCYRILIELCGKYGEPSMAVKVVQAMQRSGIEQNAVTYGIYHRAVMDATWPSNERQRAVKAWNTLRNVVTACEHFYRLGKVVKRRMSVVENEEPEEPTEDYSITVEPLEEDKKLDPLGAMKLEEELDKSLSKVAMSPSRAKFLADHESLPFSDDSACINDSRGERSGSWLKGLTNSPMFKKMIRSTTFETSKPTQPEGSIHSLVHQVKKGYDGVVKEVKMPNKIMSLVNEVSKFNKSSTSNDPLYYNEKEERNEMVVNPEDPAYQLDRGVTGKILGEEFWMREVNLQLRRQREREERGETPSKQKTLFGEETPIEVTISSATVCHNCGFVIYDEEIMAGWKVDDQNLNTVCPHCKGANNIEPGDTSEEPANVVFAPHLTVEIRKRLTRIPTHSYYRQGGLPTSPDVEFDEEDEDSVCFQSFTIEFVSPLVLRAVLERLILANRDVLKDPSLIKESPIVFWNLVYYMRRLALPSHMYSWIAPTHHIRCRYDVPELHQKIIPLYFHNPRHEKRFSGQCQLAADVWNGVVNDVKENNLCGAIRKLIDRIRCKKPDGAIGVRDHFPIFRDIHFAAVDNFGSGLLRDNLYTQYDNQFLMIPPKIRDLLPINDAPITQVTRACAKIFIPLDLF